MTEDYGAKVSKSGYDVEDSDQKQILHSKYVLLKLFAKGSGTLIKGAGITTYTVELVHNLGYIPQVYVYGEYINYNTYPTITVVERYKIFNFSDTPGLQLWDFYRYYADSTKLYIKFTSNSYIASSISLDYIYYIFYDPEA